MLLRGQEAHKNSHEEAHSLIMVAEVHMDLEHLPKTDPFPWWAGVGTPTRWSKEVLHKLTSKRFSFYRFVMPDGEDGTQSLFHWNACPKYRRQL